MRLFKTSKSRFPVSLDGLWSFKTDPDSVGEKEKWYESFPLEHDKMCVPLCWNTESEYFKYEGKAWYQTSFESTSDTYVISFDAVQVYAEVYIDGKMLASHYGGFTGFKVVGSGKGIHTLTVMADNTHNDLNTIPLSRVDWFHFGGISGSVSLCSFDGAYIGFHKISYTLNGTKATGRVDFTVCGSYCGKADIIFDGRKIASADAKSGANSIEVDFGEVELWEPSCPRLYEIGIVISSDDIIDRTGFRTIETEGNEILLNGKPLRLKGINRHNECPDFGFSIPFTLMKRDVSIIKSMNCNFIRGSHYPNPEILLDYLDETGMLFWEEIPMWQYFEKQLTDPLMNERGLSMHKEMLARDFHHPSIIFWGLHNEIDTTTQAAYDISKLFADYIRANDPSRLITFASCRHGNDICFDLADVISINMYPGWYGGHDPAGECDQQMKIVYDNMERTKSAGKPLFISEFGGGAVFGQSTFTNAKWTEQYQAELLRTLIAKFFDEYNVNGTFVWQYSDMYSAFEMELSRPRSFNNKGLVDEYRRPKLGYYAVKDIYGKY